MKIINFKKQTEELFKDVSVEETRDYLEKNMFSLDSEYIIANRDFDRGEINNVIKGLNKEVFVIMLVKDNISDVVFEASYINNTNELKGYSINLDTSDLRWTRYLASFSTYISKEFDSYDPIDGFNGFMKHSRTLFEQLDFFTLTSKEVEQIIKNNDELLVSNDRGVIVVKYQDKLETYRDFYSHDAPILNRERENRVYLMYSGTNNSIKIGRSINPSLRERTLQSEDPQLGIITCWIAPVKVEKELQKLMESKRVRGEWFNLNFGDLKQIRKYMKKYE